MKRLIYLISTKGKKPQQVAREAFQAVKKYQKIKAQIKSENSNEKPL